MTLSGPEPFAIHWQKSAKARFRCFGNTTRISGQTQKEFYVNEAHALLDTLLHMAIEGEADDPPTSPQDGETFLIGSQPTGAWSGHSGEFASWQSGDWLFCSPTPGMRIHDKATGQLARYDGTWRRAAAISDPAGGTTVDQEARSAIIALIAALVEAGTLPES